MLEGRIPPAMEHGHFDAERQANARNRKFLLIFGLVMRANRMLIWRMIAIAILALVSLKASALAQDAELRQLTCEVKENVRDCKELQKKLLAGSAPQDGKITISNNSGATIYKVFAWPTELNPRTYNALNLPLLAGDKVVINLDNAYGDCKFTLQYDPNDPKKTRVHNVRGLHRIQVKSLVQTDVDICGGRIYFWLGGVPDGKKQGKR